MKLFASVIILLLSIAAPTSVHAEAEKYSFIIPKNAEWQYKTGNQEVEADWNEPSADTSGWATGQAGFGYGDTDDRTLFPDMEGAYDTIYIKRHFRLNEVPQSLYLYLDYDDAFIAYVNGKEVARAHISRSGEVDSHEAGEIEIFEINTKDLVAGNNVIAIAGYNSSIGSSDFSLSPALAVSPHLQNIITKERALKDIAQLRARLLAQSSYLNVHPRRDPIGLLDSLNDRLPEIMERDTLRRILAIVVGQLSDGHSNVSASSLRPPSKQFLPFSLVEAEGGIVAIDTERNRFANQSHRYISAIDGRDIESWIEAGEQYRTKASPQLSRSRGIERVRYLNFLRQGFGIPPSETATITFADRQGAAIDETVTLIERRQSSLEIPKDDSRILDGNIGYLVIREMDNALIPDVIKAMKNFRYTDGLIIDVRDNGGGRYGITRALASFFVPPDHGPIVANIAAYRLAPHFAEDHLASRPTFRQDYAGWTPSERAVIEQALAQFEPEWQPTAGEFSDWHFMLINRDSDRKPYHYHYDKPIVVLSNAGSFSATDGFLASFHLLPNVTIMGQPSGGGSGRTQRFTLPESGIEIALSSMASFRTNGKLFDGNGVEVDVNIDPLSQDFIGQGDAVLDAALRELRKGEKLTAVPKL